MAAKTYPFDVEVGTNLVTELGEPSTPEIRNDVHCSQLFVSEDFCQFFNQILVNLGRHKSHQVHPWLKPDLRRWYKDDGSRSSPLLDRGRERPPGWLIGR